MKYLWNALTTLVFPYCCAACGINVLTPGAGICNRCLHELPVTGFQLDPDNPVAKVFWGRVPLERACALAWFQKKTAVQHLLHAIKYQGRKDAAVQLGRWMAGHLKACRWLTGIDALLPLPLHPSRLSQRGYNQALCISEGLSDVSAIPVHDQYTSRQSATHTQTHKHRVARWQNMQSVFNVAEPEALSGKHLLLVDDVVTTGASLDAFAQSLKNIPGVRLSVCCFAFTVPH